MATRVATRPAMLLLLALYLIAAVSLPSVGSPAEAAATMAATANQDTKSITSSTTSTTTSSSSSSSSASSSAASGGQAASAQSSQAVAAEAAAEAAAMALGGIKNGLESALSIVPASIKLPVVSPTTTAAPAGATTVVVVESSSTTTAAPATTTTTTTTSTTGAPTTAAASIEVIEVARANGSSQTEHKHSSRKINAADILHKFDLFIDPVCEQLAKLTDKQISKLLSQLKQINTLVSMNLELLLLSTLKRVPANHEHRAEKSASHDGIAKCFNEHRFGFESTSSDVMSRVQLSDFCAARNNASSENYKLWSECARRSWSPAIDKELDSSFRDRIDGQTKAAKHATSSVGGALASKLSTVELSLIDSIVSHLHDEQVQEIASELEHEQKKHNKPPVVAVNGKLSPSQIEQSQQQQASNSQQVFASSMALNQQPPPVPASSQHDQIISASPLLSSSQQQQQQQQHHELLLPNSAQPTTASNQLQLAAAGQQQQLLNAGSESTMNLGQLQQVVTTTEQQQQSVVSTINRQQQQQQHETILNVHKQQQQQQQQQLTAGSNMIAAADLVTGAAEHVGAPVALLPAANLGQHVATDSLSAVRDQAAVHPVVGAQGPAASLATAQSHQEAQSTVVQQQQTTVATHEQQHSNDLVQIAKMGTVPAAADEHHQLVSTSASSASSSTRQETIQVMPTISPIASFLLNSIDFATRPPSTVHPAASVPQAAVVPVGASPLVVPAAAQQPEMPIVVPADTSAGAIAAVNHEQLQQQQQKASLTSSSSSISASRESTMSSNVGQAAAIQGDLIRPALAPEPNLAPAIASPAAALVTGGGQSAQPILVHPPVANELLPAPLSTGLGGAAVAAVAPGSVKAAETASITASASQHTETIVTPEPPLPLMQQQVDGRTLIDPAVIKNVNSALEAMANTNISSGVVSVSSGNSSNTTLFIMSPSTTSTTPTPAATTTTTTTAKPTSTTTSTAKPAERRNKKGKSHDEKFAELRAKFGAAQVHDVIVIGEHKDGDDELEDYDDHHEHHDGEHEHSEHHGEGSLTLAHSSGSKSSERHKEQTDAKETKTTTTLKPSTTKAAAATSSSTTTSKPTTTTTTKGPLAKITTTIVDGGLDEEHKDHEHLLAGLKAGDVIHVDAGEAA